MNGLLGILLRSVATVFQEWMEADAQKRAEIEARALQAAADMVTTRAETGSAHERRTQETLALIKAAMPGEPTQP